MKALAVTQLKKTYANGFEALKTLDLSVEEGDFYALLGPNGAGKSTLIGIICSLLKKTSGHISVFGHDIDRALIQVKQSIGLVPQEFNFNIFEPLLEVLINQAGYYGIRRHVALNRSHELLERLGLGDKKTSTARELSGGMKRRLMVARSLVHHPKLLLLDEPTAGVDIEIRQSMWQYLKELNKSGTTIILTTHYLEEAEQLCRHIGIISEGKVLENTSMKKLLSKLHRETYILELAHPIDSAPTLANIPTQLIDSETLLVDLHKDTHMSTLFHHLSEHSIEVASLHSKTNRLEELFISMVNQNSEQTRC